MEGDKHFSHDHPLISFLEENYEDDDKGYLCRLCGLPILSSPSYTCTRKTCNFFLHKPCADNSPEDFKHPNHLPSFKNHRLHLEPSGKNYTYKCRLCEFHIHPLELQPVAIKTMHKSHQPHPLTAVCKETTCRCDACAQEHKGFFFCCQRCNFWIHQDCALMPSFVEIPSSQHHYPFILTYYIDFIALTYGTNAPYCFICGGYGHLVMRDGVYFCGDNISYAHVSCVKLEMVALDTDATKRGIIQLPDEEDIFPSLVIRRYAEGNPDLQVSQLHYNKEFHEHGLILDEGTRTNNNKDNNDSSSSSTTGRRAPRSLICDVCTQRIDSSSPFFRCELLDCHFLVHTICASLPTKIRYLNVWGQWRESNISRHMKYLNAVSECCHCWRISNGYNYYSGYPHPHDVDPECMVTPRTIKHASHRQHVLFELLYCNIRNIPFNCCSSSSGGHYFRCVVCDFYIHKRCALLPKWTRHKFDEHPLELITAAAHHHNHEDDDDDDHDDQECVFCEFCEQDIDQHYWYYGCRKCEHYFHINCVPSTGELSKVKFGKTLAVDAYIHPHPVTLTRMLTIGRHERCGICNQIIEGFVDEMAFHCSECNFWIHFFCLENSVYPLMDY